MLENEKQNTIQLVHWKATNQKKEVELQDSLKKYEEIDKGPNIGELVTKLNKAKSKLETLKKDTDELDLIHEREIKRPLTSIDRTRKKITTTLIERSNFLQPRQQAQSPTRSRQLKSSQSQSRPENTTATMGTDILQALIEENTALQSRNQSLKRQIEEMELAKKSFPQEVLETVEGIKPSPRLLDTKNRKTRPPLYAPKSSRATPRAITRPMTATAIQKTQTQTTTTTQLQLKPTKTGVQRKRPETTFAFL